MTGCDIFLSLGSNQGAAEIHLEAAIDAIGSLPGVELKQRSPVYLTAPQDVTGQPDFHNIVLWLVSPLSHETLFPRLQDIEHSIGNSKPFPKGPRKMDIDVLLWGDHIIDTPTLVVPHPRMAMRHFVLKPLCDICPSVRHPALNKTAHELFERLTVSDLNWVKAS